MNLYYSSIASPVGTWQIIASEQGIHWLGLVLEQGLIQLKKTLAIEHLTQDPNFPIIKKTTNNLTQYFNGQKLIVDTSLILAGTPFQMQVWNEIAKIPQGQTRSYKQLAVALGKPDAIRAVGTACGKNPVLLLIPCHRVIASNGTLGGYVGGLEIKKQLLELEKVFK